MIGFDPSKIGQPVRITQWDVRALSPKINKRRTTARLKRHAINALLKGRHASVGGKSIAARAKNLLDIASAYSREELLEEPGIGIVTAIEIQLWLEERGRQLRNSSEPEVGVSAGMAASGGI